jgi:His/Glu/Gln/Arg/opine family amino acid ABC transporter permease subunit
MTLDFSSIAQYWPVFAEGLFLTLAASLLALAIALALGAVLAVCRLSRSRLASSAALVFVEVMRDLPFMVLVFLIFYLLPALDIRLPPFEVGVLTLGLYEAAYFAEIIRGAILSVPKGQMESARAIGMSRAQAFRHVIFPQMMGYFLPPVTNQAVMVVKDSSILSTITVVELTMSGRIVVTYTVAPIEIFLIISILYWLICSGLSRAGAWLERALQPHRRPSAAPARRPAYDSAHV